MPLHQSSDPFALLNSITFYDEDKPGGIMDVTSLTLTRDVAVPKRTYNGTRADNDYFTQLLTESGTEYDASNLGKGMTFHYVPNHEARPIANRLRRAADAMGIGLRVVFMASPVEGDDGEPVFLGELALARVLTEDGERTGRNLVLKADPDTDYVGPVDITFAAKRRKNPRNAATTTPDSDTADTMDTDTDGTDAVEVPEAVEDTPKPRRSRRS